MTTTKKKYAWLQESLTLDKQREILEERREYLLQLMPEVNVNAGSADIKLIDEWSALQLHRDKLLHSLIDKENAQSLDSCYLSLLHALTTVGSYNHSSTPQPLKQALYALYWQLKQYFRDVDVTQIDTSLTSASAGRSSPQKRKSRKTRTKLNKPDLIPSIHVNQDSMQDDVQAYRSPKRYKPNAPVQSHAVVCSERTQLLAQKQSSSEWESADDSMCSVDVTDLNTSAYCSDVPDTAQSTGSQQGEAPRTPRPNNVSFTNPAHSGLVTPKSIRAPNYGRTPVSTRTPLIRGVISYTPAPPSSKSKQRATLYRRSPYKTNKTASPVKRRSPHKKSPRKATSALFRQIVRAPSPDSLSQVSRASDVCRGSDVRRESDVSRASDVSKTSDVIRGSDVSRASDVRRESDVRKTSDVTPGDDDVAMDIEEDSDAMSDVLSAQDLHAELQKENIVGMEVSTKPGVKRPAAHAVDEHDKAVARALQKTFQNYRRGGVYTSPIKIKSAADEKEESFNISID